jgi:hypothetical protein
MNNESKNNIPDELYEDGKKLVECLDKEGFNYPLILWMKLPDKKEWTLILGIPGMKIIGTNDILGNIKRIIRENELEISESKISLIDSQDKLCFNFRSTIKTGTGIGRINLSATQINGQKIPQSVIYRIN